MSTGIMTGTDTLGVRRPRTQERTPSRARGTSAGTIGGTGTRRRRLVPPRTGSLQQISVRGRRIAAREEHSSVYLKLVIALVILVGVGVAAAMFLSGKTTEQAFVLKDAQSRSDTLSKELETLNRDYRELSSSENLTAEATRLGMVVPGQAGVLNVQGDDVQEVRPGTTEGEGAVVDLDATHQGVPRTDRPTTDPQQNAGRPPASVDPDSISAGDGDAAAPANQTPAAAGAAAAGTGQLPY